ncbi:alpha/beta fold hydrolase [Paraburkholderia sp. 2C]
MLTDKPSFLLVHGAWHGASTWRHLAPLLEARGHIVRAYDLPGAGAQAKQPASYLRLPRDNETFAAEPTLNAGITQDDRTRAAIGWIEDMHRQTGLPVIPVGHSLGGVTVTGVAQARPELVHAAVYLAAYLVPPGQVPAKIRALPSMSGSLIGLPSRGDPLKTGASRIDPRNPDPAYRELLRRAFYGDIDEAALDDELSLLHCDEPVAALTAPSEMTRERFGSVPRHYIRTAGDASMMPGAQDHLISAVDATMGNATTLHTLPSGHSPHVTQPASLAELLCAIAANV